MAPAAPVSPPAKPKRTPPPRPSVSLPKSGGARAAIAAGALVVVACGGSGDSTSPGSTTAGTTSSQKQTKTTTTGASKNAVSGPNKGKSSGSSEAKEASEFVPKPHTDSGGGSKQFEVKGADNSVQEFGGEAGTSELDKAATVLHDFLDARAEGNWAATCTYMSKTVIESFEKLAAPAKQVDDKSCGEILEKLTNPAAKQSMKAEAEKANVGSLRIEGEQSFLIYTGLKGTILAMPIASEGGAWKVASLAGTPLN